MREMDTTTRSTVLLVEDDAIIALAEAQQIRALGYEVKIVYTGEVAVELATADFSIDLVLMDIDLGEGMDGTEAAAQILQRRDLPVIFLSSHTEKDIVERTSRITNYGYVTKSAGSTVLDASMRMAMRLFEATRQVREELEQRRRYEEALTKSTSLIEHIINNLSEGLIVCDTELRYLVWNPVMERLTGMKAADILGRYPYQVFPKLTETGVIDSLETALSGTTPAPVEHTLSLNGHDRQIISSSTPLRDSDNAIIGAVTIVQDVTEAREDRERVHRSEAKYRELFEYAPIGIFRTDSAGRVLEGNSEFAHIYGFASVAKAVGYYTDVATQMWADPAQRQGFLKALEEVGYVNNLEVEEKTWDGRRIWVSLNARLSERDDNGSFVIEGFTIDITRMRQSEEKLQESNERLNGMLEAIPDLVFSLRRDGVFLDYKANANDLYVTPETQIVGKHHRDLLPLEFSDLLQQKISETLERRTLTSYTYVLEIPARGQRQFEARMVPSGADEVTAVVRDITDEAIREAQRSDSEHLFRTAFNNAPIGVVFTDLDGILKRVNKAYCTMLGYSAEELVGRSIFELTLPDDTRYSTDAIARLRDGGFESVHFSKRYVHKNGSIVWAEVNTTVVVGADGRPRNILAQIRDITEQKRSEESVYALIREKELLLGEVHHRIKNNLSTVVSLLSLQARRLKNSPAVAALEDAQGRLRTISVLYDRLRRAENFSELSIADYLSSVTDDIVATNPSTAKVNVVKKLDEYPVSAQKLSSVGIVANELICNAMKYAFSERDTGTLTVEARRNNGTAIIVVADDGVGLPDDVGIGMSEGFGMVVVGALARQLGGDVRIERGNGTRFVLQFPI